MFYYTPSPLPIGIIGLGANYRKIFGLKGLIRKIFRNKDLAPKTALKMSLGQLRGAVLGDRHTFSLPHQALIIAPGELTGL